MFWMKEQKIVSLPPPCELAIILFWKMLLAVKLPTLLAYFLKGKTTDKDEEEGELSVWDLHLLHPIF